MTPMLDCDAVMRQLWDFLDGELSADREAAMRQHLALCARCFPQMEFERAFLETLGRVRRDHANLDQVRAHVLAALSAEGFRAA